MGAGPQISEWEATTHSLNCTTRQTSGKCHFENEVKNMITQVREQIERYFY